MQRILTFVVLALLAVAPALAQEAVPLREETLAEAVRGLLSGAPAVRDAARTRLAAEPETAVTLLTQLVEELRLARSGADAELAVLDAVDDDVVGAGDLLQMYDVRDLLAREPDPEAFLERLRAIGSGAVLRVNEASPGVLIVTGAAKVHEALQAKLDDLRADLAPMVMIDVRFVEADRMQDLGLDLVGQRPGSVILSEGVLERIAAWQAAGRAEIVSAPRLATVLGQQANVTIGREISYVEDFEIEVGQSTWFADPVVGTVFDGTMLDVTVAAAGEDGLRIDLEHRTTDVQEPMETIAVDVGAGTPVEVQVPDLYEARVQRALAIADGGEALLVLPGPPDAVRLLAIAVRKVELSEDR